MATQKRDYYEVLEVSRTAEFEEVKRSYRKLAVKYHPDKNPGDHQAEESFKELGEAYDVLMDAEKRGAYDRYGHAAFQQGGGSGGAGFHDPFDLFREVFGGSGGSGGIFDHFFGGGGGATRDGSGRQRGSDLRYDIQITLEEAATGCEKEIEIQKLDHCGDCEGSGAQKGSKKVTCSVCHGRGQVVASRGFFQIAQTCPNCQGTGQVIEKPCKTCHGEGRYEKRSRIKLKIPAGIEDESRLRSTGSGEAGIRGGHAGDLYTVIHVREHAIFQRDGMNLYCDVPLPFTTAALGGEIEVPTLKGPAKLKIPAGTQGGAVFKLKGSGMPALQSTSRGDLLTSVQVEVPSRLNAEQRQKLEEFAELCGAHNSPLHKSFYDRVKEFFQ
ncbi:MAG: molecular chaperone DnaJ [Chthoniobacterales bacterium]